MIVFVFNMTVIIAAGVLKATVEYGAWMNHDAGIFPVGFK